MSAPDAYRPALHRYALAVAAATGALLFIGGLVTSTGSALAVPDWPLSFGKLFPRMTGGVLSMIWVTIRAFRGKYAGGKYQGIETIGLYWHFVDLVWIILFTIVYLI